MINEQSALIGCLLIGDNAGEIFVDVSADDFQDDIYRDIFLKLQNRWKIYGELDLASISDFPDEQKQVAVISAETVPSLSSWRTYASLAKEHRIKSRAAEIGLGICTGNLEVEEIQQKAEQLLQLATGTEPIKSLNMKAGVLDFMKRKNTPKIYYRTGYNSIDKHTFIDKGDYVVIGGRPSSGKTAFSLNVAIQLAFQKYKVVFFSLETSCEKIMDRIMTTICGLNFGNVKRQEMQSEWSKAAEKSDVIATLPIEIVPASGKTVAWIKAEAMRRGAKIIIVDYLGLINSTGNSRYEQVTNISRDLHIMAQTTGITVIALSQLSRKDRERKPDMEDLRESGQIEQDADLILMCHNDKQNNEYWIVIAKNKEGETGDVQFIFDGVHQRFHEILLPPCMNS